MNHEVKFRGWDTKKKIMYSPEEMGRDQLTISTDGRGFINVHSKSTELSKFYGHIIPEQYTGRKSKNLKEIFQGDLVKSSFGNIYEVVFDEFGYHFKAIGEKTRQRERCGCTIKNEAWEVIGTIHDEERII